MSNRSYAILGTGALGGYYGACLQRAGLDVHFLLRSDYEQVRDSGLAIESPDGDFTLPHVKAYDDVAKIPPCDGCCDPGAEDDAKPFVAKDAANHD